MATDDLYLYRKCSECHLFVEPNSAYEDDPDNLAPWVHLMGECVFCVATDESHEAKPDLGEPHTIEWWKENGPLFMRMRFNDSTIPHVDPISIFIALDLDFKTGTDDEGNRSIEVLHQYVLYVAV